MQWQPAVAILFCFFFSSCRTSRASVVIAGARSLAVLEEQPTTAAPPSLGLQPMLQPLLLEHQLLCRSPTCSPSTCCACLHSTGRRHSHSSRSTRFRRHGLCWPVRHCGTHLVSCCTWYLVVGPSVGPLTVYSAGRMSAVREELKQRLEQRGGHLPPRAHRPSPHPDTFALTSGSTGSRRSVSDAFSRTN